MKGKQLTGAVRRPDREAGLRAGKTAPGTVSAFDRLLNAMVHGGPPTKRKPKGSKPGEKT